MRHSCLLVWSAFVPALAAEVVPAPLAAPDWPRPLIEYFVSPAGSDTNPGKENAPFASIERARDALRAWRQANAPAGPATIWLADGTYPATGTLLLEKIDSGTAGQPVSIRARPGARPVVSGFTRLTRFVQLAEHPDAAARLPEAARGFVVGIGVPAEVTLPPMELAGFGSGRGFRTHPLAELYCNGRPMPMARGPDAGVAIREVGPDEPVDDRGAKGSKSGRIGYEGEAPARWAGDPNAWLHGYWFWDWAESYERLDTVDPAKHEIRLTPPLHNYGFRQGQRFLAVHALAELDKPGEWYLDPARRLIWFWPPSDPVAARLELAACPFPFVAVKDVSHVRFEGITWEGGAGDGLCLSGGTGCLIVSCTVRAFGGDGVVVDGGTGHTLLGCDIHTLGRGAIVLRGGDRKTLQPGSHRVENCHLHDLSRIDRTYTPAILCEGVGHHLARNLIHHVPSSAIRLGGNDHVVELNEVSHVVTESDDQGAVDMWGDPTLRGNVFRWNYFHHVGSQWGPSGKEPKLGQAGIRLDDAISGSRITGNLFFRCGGGGHGFGGVQIHGGKDNVVAGNLFVECRAAVSLSPWADDRWKEFAGRFPDSPQIDRGLYESRYPAMRRLLDDANANEVRGNLVVNCGTLLHHGPGRTVAAANRVVAAQPGFAVTPEGTLVLPARAEAWTDAGLARIPFEQIGPARPRGNDGGNRKP